MDNTYISNSLQFKYWMQRCAKNKQKCAKERIKKQRYISQINEYMLTVIWKRFQQFHYASCWILFLFFGLAIAGGCTPPLIVEILWELPHPIHCSQRLDCSGDVGHLCLTSSPPLYFSPKSGNARHAPLDSQSVSLWSHICFVIRHKMKNNISKFKHRRNKII